MCTCPPRRLRISMVVLLIHLVAIAVQAQVGTSPTDSEPTAASDSTPDPTPTDAEPATQIAESTSATAAYDVQLFAGGCASMLAAEVTDSLFLFFEAQQVALLERGLFEVEIFDDSSTALTGQRVQLRLGSLILWLGIAQSDATTMVAGGIGSGDYLMGRAATAGELSGRYLFIGSLVDEASPEQEADPVANEPPLDGDVPTSDVPTSDANNETDAETDGQTPAAPPDGQTETPNSQASGNRTPGSQATAEPSAVD